MSAFRLLALLSLLLSAAMPALAQKIMFEEDVEEADAPEPRVIRPLLKSLDANKDGVLSLEESKLSESEFERLDVFEDGSLELDEWQASDNEYKIQQTRQTMIFLHGAFRSGFMKYSQYPKSAEQMVEWRLVDAAPVDGWGKAIRFTYDTSKGESGDDDMSEEEIMEAMQNARTRAQRDALRAKLEAKLSGQSSYNSGFPQFEFRSGGLDGQLDTDDDIIKTPSILCTPVTRVQRAKLQRDSQEQVEKAREGFAWEQCFRLWIAMAAHRVENELEQYTLDGFALPAEVFPDGVPLDVYGRRFELKQARGIIALSAPAVEGGPDAIAMTESDFMTNYVRRLQGPHEIEYNAEELIERIQRFYRKDGRLPVTEDEAPSYYYWREDDTTGLYYHEINEGKNYAIIRFGSDNRAGGIGEEMDWVYYGPGGDMGSLDASYSHIYWPQYEYTQYRYQALIQAMAASDKSDDEPDEGAESGDASSEEGPPPPSGDAQAIEEEDGDGTGDASEAESEEGNESSDAESAEAENASDAAEGEAEAAKPEAKPTFRYAADMIPNAIYTESEAQQLGVTDDGYYWYHQQVLDIFYQSVKEFVSSKKGLERAHTLCGNVELSHGEAFYEQSGAPWKDIDDNYYDPWDDIDALIVARVQRDEPGAVDHIVVFMLPKKTSEMPIMIASRINGSEQGRLVASLNDQPEGWREWVKSINGLDDIEENDPVFEAIAKSAQDKWKEEAGENADQADEGEGKTDGDADDADAKAEAESNPDAKADAAEGDDASSDSGTSESAGEALKEGEASEEKSAEDKPIEEKPAEADKAEKDKAESKPADAGKAEAAPAPPSPGPAAE